MSNEIAEALIELANRLMGGEREAATQGPDFIWLDLDTEKRKELLQAAGIARPPGTNYHQLSSEEKHALVKAMKDAGIYDPGTLPGAETPHENKCKDCKWWGVPWNKGRKRTCAELYDRTGESIACEDFEAKQKHLPMHAPPPRSCANCKWWGVAWGKSKLKQTCEQHGYTPHSVCTNFEANPNTPPEFAVRVPSIHDEKLRYLDLAQNFDMIVRMMKGWGFIEFEGAWYNFYWARSEAEKELKVLNETLYIRKTVGHVTTMKIESVSHIWRQLPEIARKWLDTKGMKNIGKKAMLELIAQGRPDLAIKVAEALLKL